THFDRDRVGLLAHADFYHAVFRELDGVGHEVQQDLPQLDGVAFTQGGPGRVHGQLEPACPRDRAHHGRDLACRRGDVDFFVLELHAARLDAGDVEYLV